MANLQFFCYNLIFFHSTECIFDVLTSDIKIKELQGNLLRNFLIKLTTDQIKLITEIAGFLLDKNPHQLFYLERLCRYR